MFARLYHISDIHIRMYARHGEYRVVFENLYEALDGATDAAVVITGDILHNKIDLTPECCLIVHEFLTRLGQIMPVFMIAGNHDALLNNRDRVDSLTSILHDRLPHNVHYLRDTGCYEHENIVFVVNSLLDAEEREWISCADVRAKTPTDKKVIALYHGQVGHWTNTAGFKSQTYEKAVDDFDGADMVLLGDIHKHQYMDGERRRMAYAGSLISQNLTETDDDHGVLTWRVADGTSSFTRVANPYAYKDAVYNAADDTMRMDGVNHAVDRITLPEKGTLRIRLSDNVAANRDMLTRLHQRYPTLRVQTVFSAASASATTSTTMTAVDDDLAVLQGYVQDRWRGRENVDRVVTELSRYFHEHRTGRRDQTDWKLVSVRFDLMFGYGKDNVIDFEKFQPHTMTGIFGSNSAGKSTLIDILSFMLFGKITRSAQGNSTPREIIHCAETQSYGEVVIRIGESLYKITKKCSRQKNDKIKIVEKLFEIGADGRVGELTDEQRRRTDKRIAEKVGTLDNFLMTSVMLQQKERSFREMTQSLKKDFLYNLFHLDWFEKLRKEKEEACKQAKIQAEVLYRRISGKTMEGLSSELAARVAEDESIRAAVVETEAVINTVVKEKERLLLQMIPVECTDASKLQRLEERMAQSTRETETIQRDIIEHAGIMASIPYDTLLASATSASSTIPADFMKRWGDDGKNRIEDWREEYTRFMGMVRDFDKIRAASKEKKAEYEAALQDLQRQRPNLTTGVCVSEEEWQRIASDYKTRGATIAALRQEMMALREAITADDAVSHDRLEGIIQTLDKQISEYKMTESYYQMHLQNSTENENILYNPDCHACVQNPNFLKKKEMEIRLVEMREKQESALQEIYSEIARFGCEATTIEAWEETRDRYIASKRSIAKKRQRMDKIMVDMSAYDKISTIYHEQELLRAQRKIDAAVRKIQKAVTTDEAIVLYNTLQDTMSLVPVYNEMNEVWSRAGTTDQIRLYETARDKKAVLEKRMIVVRESLDADTKDHARVKMDIAAMEENAHLTKKLGKARAVEEEHRAVLRDMGASLRTNEIAMEQVRIALDDFEKTHGEWTELCGAQQVMEMIIKTIERDGLPLFLLSSKLPVMEDYMNQIIRPFMSRPVVFRIQEKDIVLGVATTESSASGFYGGMEAFIVDVALKMTFGKFGDLPRSDFFFVDEGVSVLDQDKIASIGTVFDCMLAFNDRVFVMSHLPVIKDFVTNRIEIRKDENTMKSFLNIFL
jgi:DNA repair exonuclease SbcCD ATPase subunit